MSGPVEMEEATYHRHPALSASGAKLLLPPNCPAIYRYRMDNPPEPKDVFDFGHAAHTLVLGKGAPLVDVGFDAWTSAAAKKAKEAARAEGKTPLRSQDYAAVHAMADALLQHDLAAALLSNGSAEQKVFWTDEESGIPLRSMLDYHRTGSERLLITDYKTAASASPERFSRSLMDFGYALQSAFYLEAARATGLTDGGDAAFLFVVQAKDAPYLVSVFQPDEQAVQIGRQLMRQAIDIFAECNSVGNWPGYTSGIEMVSVMPWEARKFEVTG